MSLSKKILKLALVAGMVAIALSQTVFAKIIYVKTDGSNNAVGTSWTTAYKTVTKALDAAVSGDEVWIKAGIYREDKPITMKNGVGIYGGFRGDETAKNERVPGNETVLSGENTHRVISNNFSSTNPLTSSAVLDTVTVANGYHHTAGGGMYNSYASPTVSNCTFTQNAVFRNGTIVISGLAGGNGGAGMHNTTLSNPTVKNCTFSKNTTSFYGGAMYNGCYGNSRTPSTPIVINCTFNENTASYGGGIYNDYVSPTFINCTISGNSGSGMINSSVWYIADSEPIVYNCIFWGNDGAQIYGSSRRIYNNVVQGGYSGTGNKGADPYLLPLANYGGFVPTMPVKASSSAIGTGVTHEQATEDATGKTRNANNPCTAGAVEFSGSLVGVIVKEATNHFVQTYEFTLEANTTSASATYQWYKDGILIGGATETTHKTTQEERSAVYHCEVMIDGAMKKTSSVTITTTCLRIHVSTSGDDANYGSSWENSKATVGAALAAAVDGCEIWIAEGVYAQGSALRMKNGVGIYGGFAGIETTKNERVAGKKTILDGNKKYQVFDNAFTSLEPLTSTAILDNVTIANSGAESSGGSGINIGTRYYGMYNIYASPTITNCTFTENAGAGMYNNNSSPTIINSTFSRNSGAGMYNHYSPHPIVVNCTFSENSGNGIYNSSSHPKILNCIVWGNLGSGEIINSSSLSLPQVAYSIVQGGYEGEENLDEDPLLMPFGDYGESLPIAPVRYGSPAIGASATQEQADEIFGKGVVKVPDTDAIGQPRSSTGCAIGAIELKSGFVSNIITVKEDTNCFSKTYQFTLEAYTTSTDTRYQWYKDDKKIYGATSATYTIMQDEDTADYYCVVTVDDVSRDTVRVTITTTLARIHVATSGNDDNDGSDWKNAKATVCAAIDAVGYGAEVWIAKGRYQEGKAITMKNAVGIYGGFTGIETSKCQRAAGNATILDGNKKHRVFTNSFTWAKPLASTAILDNITLTNSNGYGMYNYYASPTITNCTFSENSETGMTNSSSATVVINCTFSGNSGTGMLNYTSHPAIINSTFSRNSGYGIRNLFSSNPKIVNCILWGNLGNTGDSHNIYLGNNDFLPIQMVNDFDSSPIVTCSIVQGGYKGEGNLDEDPLLMPLAYYGGNIPTMPVKADSPAIGKGAMQAQAPTDAIGQVRDEACTIGAVEFNEGYINLDTTVKEGKNHFSTTDEFTLEAWATSPDVTYQWYKNGKAISGATDATYTTTQSENTASYYCEITVGDITQKIDSITITTTAPSTTYRVYETRISARTSVIREMSVRVNGSPSTKRIHYRAPVNKSYTFTMTFDGGHNADYTSTGSGDFDGKLYFTTSTGSGKWEVWSGFGGEWMIFLGETLDGEANPIGKNGQQIPVQFEYFNAKGSGSVHPALFFTGLATLDNKGGYVTNRRIVNSTGVVYSENIYPLSCSKHDECYLADQGLQDRTQSKKVPEVDEGEMRDGIYYPQACLVPVGEDQWTSKPAHFFGTYTTRYNASKSYRANNPPSNNGGSYWSGGSNATFGSIYIQGPRLISPED